MTMNASKILDYLILAAGVVLAFVAALEPQLVLGYQLGVGILLAGLLPYFVYSLAVPLMNGALVTLHGAGLLILHGWLIYRVRLVAGGEWGAEWLVYGPLVLSVALLPLLVMALRRPYGREASV